jgi:hypothetical protein
VNTKVRVIVLAAVMAVLAGAAVVVRTPVSQRHKRTDSAARAPWSALQAPIDARAPVPTTNSASTSPTAPASSTTPPTPPRGPVAPPPTTGTLHFIANVDDQIAAVEALGFNLVDMGSDPESVNALPAGVRALVWLGSLDNHDCANPGYTFSAFMDAVNRLVGNPKVFGYFLADEPHPKDCPTTADDLRERADYIHAHDPTHRSFIVVLDGSNQCGGTYGCEYSALAPAKTHVDLIGLDPYPCNTGNASTGCDYQHIDATVQRAEQHGIPANDIVPVFQMFGQSCADSNYYRLPKASELTTMLAHWKLRVPHAAFDYAYTWARQGSACPSLADANGSGGYPDLQAVIKAHNLG